MQFREKDNVPREVGWRSTVRLRGSLTGEAVSDEPSPVWTGSILACRVAGSVLCASVCPLPSNLVSCCLGLKRGITGERSKAWAPWCSVFFGSHCPERQRHKKHVRSETVWPVGAAVQKRQTGHTRTNYTTLCVARTRKTKMVNVVQHALENPCDLTQCYFFLKTQNLNFVCGWDRRCRGRRIANQLREPRRRYKLKDKKTDKIKGVI